MIKENDEGNHSHQQDKKVEIRLRANVIFRQNLMDNDFQKANGVHPKGRPPRNHQAAHGSKKQGAADVKIKHRENAQRIKYPHE